MLTEKDIRTAFAGLTKTQLKETIKDAEKRQASLYAFRSKIGEPIENPVTPLELQQKARAQACVDAIEETELFINVLADLCNLKK